jgi:hypothetical protein
MNGEILKKAGGGNYFDELLERIRDIRFSKKVFWRKVFEIYATSIDYDPRTEMSKRFFQTMQKSTRNDRIIIGIICASLIL